MERNRKCSPQTVALLAALLDAGRGWCHGYDLSRATGLKSGTLYPILLRLSDRGLLESKWEQPGEPGRPPRHLYRLNPRGVAFACAQQAAPARTPSRLQASFR